MITIRSLGTRRTIKGVPITDFTPVSTVEITTTILNAAFENIPFSQTLTATGGSGTKVWSLQSGTLPDGLTLSSGGVLSGTPEETGTFGSLAIRVTDDSGFDQETFSITVGEEPEEDDHTFFETLTAPGFPYHLRSHSLRSTQSITDAAGGNETLNYWSYDPTIDAAKLIIEVDSNNDGGSSDSLSGKASIDLFAGVEDKVLFIYDVMFGEDHRWNTAANKGTGGPSPIPKPIGGYKIFAAKKGDTPTGGGRAWHHFFQFSETFQDSNPAPEIALIEDGDLGFAPGTNTQRHMNPSGEGATVGTTTPVYYHRWMRYWVEFDLNIPGTDDHWEWHRNPANTGITPTELAEFEAGTWHSFSLWMADSSREPIRQCYRVPFPRGKDDLTPSTYISFFELAWNTSSHYPCKVHAYATSGASTNPAGTVVTLAGNPDLSRVLLNGKYKIWLANNFANMLTITAVDDGANTVTVDGAFTGDLTNQPWAIGGPNTAWARNLIALHNYQLPLTNPESDTTIFVKPLVGTTP